MVSSIPPVRRLLIVEDVQETREAMEKLFLSDGYAVDPVRSVTDAIQRAHWQRPDLILISLVGSGEELTLAGRRIRELAGLTEAVPVVIFSINAISEGREIALPGNIHIISPQNFNHLRALVRRVLQRKASTE